MKSIHPHTGAETVEVALNEIYSSRKSSVTAPPRSALRNLGLWSIALVAPVLASVATAADLPAAPAPAANNTAWQKPSWLTDLSLGVKETYDDNIFLAGANSADYPVGTDLTKVPSSIAIGAKNTSSFITTVSPKVGINFAPLLGDQKILQVLSLGYSPDFVTYHARSSESYNAHRLGAAIKGKSENISFNLENSFNSIEGSKLGPLFPGGLNSAYATAAARERREQYQDRSAISFQYDHANFFVRPTASFLYYDLNTEQLTKAQTGNQAGYQNYADRYDVNGGLDLGYKIAPQFAATLGYRTGAQYQQQYTSAIDSFAVHPGVIGLSSSSDYQRVLVGIEGKPFKWLDARLQAGPDFRQYSDHAPVTDPNLVTYYGEASLTATITTRDILAFKYKQYQWVSSTGKAPYFDSSYDLSYKRKLTDKLSLDLGARYLDSDYTSGLNTANAATYSAKQANPRDDTQTTLSAGLTYAFNTHASVNLAYSLDLGRNAQDNIVNDATRQFDHNVVSVGATLKF